MSSLNAIFGSWESEEKRKEYMKGKGKEKGRGKKILLPVCLDVNGKKIEKKNICRKIFYYFILVNYKLWINYGI